MNTQTKLIFIGMLILCVIMSINKKPHQWNETEKDRLSNGKSAAIAIILTIIFIIFI